MTIIFWDLHSIIHIPVCQKDPIYFYHASFRDFLTDRHRSGSLYVDEFKARSFLLKLCIQTLSDFYGRSTQKITPIALQYSRIAWQSHCELQDGFDKGAPAIECQTGTRLVSPRCGPKKKNLEALTTKVLGGS